MRSWSPDGRSVLVAGTDVGGKAVRYAVDTDTGRATSVIPGDAIARPDWRTDGRIVYHDPAKGRLLAHNVQTGGEDESSICERSVSIRFPTSAAAVTAWARTGGRWHTRCWTRAPRPWPDLVDQVLGGGPQRELVVPYRPERPQFQDWTPDGASLIYTRWIAKPSSPRVVARVDSRRRTAVDGPVDGWRARSERAPGRDDLLCCLCFRHAAVKLELA